MPPSEQSEQKYNTGVADSEDTLASLLAVQQPGRHLPPVPVGRPDGQSSSCERGAVGGAPDYLQRRPRHDNNSVQGHVYQSIDDDDTSSEAKPGARRKTGLPSNSQMDVQMKDQYNDRVRLLDMVKSGVASDGSSGTNTDY